MMNHDTGNKPISFLNPKLEDLKKRITQFISEINPELSENEKGMCGNISTDEGFPYFQFGQLPLSYSITFLFSL